MALFLSQRDGRAGFFVARLAPGCCDEVLGAQGAAKNHDAHAIRGRFVALLTLLTPIFDELYCIFFQKWVLKQALGPKSLPNRSCVEVLRAFVSMRFGAWLGDLRHAGPEAKQSESVNMASLFVAGAPRLGMKSSRST